MKKYINNLQQLLLTLLALLTLPGCAETVDGMVDDVNRGLEIGRAEARGLKGSDRLLTDSCPSIQIVDDLGSLSDFTDEHRMILENMLAEMKIQKGKSGCELANSSATVDMTLKFIGTLGPKARQRPSDKPFLTYPFFVAVTGPNGKIMAKEVFAVSMSFEPGETTRTHTEYLRQIIPIKGPDVAFQYQVLVGFQLSPEQLAYNRKALAPGRVPVPKRKPRITFVTIEEAAAPAQESAEDRLIEDAAANNPGASGPPLAVMKEPLP